MENKKETLTAAEEQKRQQQFIEKARIYVREKSEELGRPLYACTTTFGCQMTPATPKNWMVFWKRSVISRQIKKTKQTLLFTIPVRSVRMPTSVSMAAWDILAA